MTPMKVVDRSGLAVEIRTATPRASTRRPARDDRLVLRDLAILQLRRLGWTRGELECCFGLSKSAVNGILAQLRAAKAALLAREGDAA
jgi:hypothetical protein